MTPPLVVPRTVTALQRANEPPWPSQPVVRVGRANDAPRPSQPLSAFNDARALVLLGDPGAGKTTEFRRAAQAEGCVYVSARRFMRDAACETEWRGKTLFIDGLDEVRAGDGDPRMPLDVVLACLRGLGLPPVRISCRSTGWLAEADEEEFRSLPGYEDLVLLQLDPLTSADVEALLESHGVQDADKFVASARDDGLLGLLDHPLTLYLLAKAFAADGCWPAGRRETFEMACRALAREHNKQHRAARRVGVSLDDAISAAGRLAAFFLIGGRDRILQASEGPPGPTAANADMLLSLEEIPGEAASHGGMNVLAHALSTNLFRFAGVAGAFVPVHRSVAEHLAGRHLHECIERGVPVGRVLAILSGADGIVVPSLRGLAAWLATLNSGARDRLADQIPFEALESGDPALFPPDQKLRLVRALAQLPRHRGFMLRQTSRAVRSAMAGPETMVFLQDCIAKNEPGDQPQSVVEFLFDALAADPLPHSSFSVSEAVAVARDDRWMFAARKAALAAAMRIAEQGDESRHLLATMLKDLSAGRIKDVHQELRAQLVEGLFPRHLEPSEIPAILPPSVGPMLKWHLSRALVDKTEDLQVPEVLDALCVLDRDQSEADDYPDMFGGVTEEAFADLLERGLRLRGETIAVDRLYDWLSVTPDMKRDPLDEWLRDRLSVPSETERLRPARDVLAPWLARRPDMRRRLLREHVRRERRLTADRRRGDVRIGERHGHARMSRLLFLGFPSGEAVAMCFEEAVGAAATALDDARRYVDMGVAQRRLQLQPPKGATFADALTGDWLAWASVQLGGAPELVEYLGLVAEQEAKVRQARVVRETRRRESRDQAVLQRREALLKRDASLEFDASSEFIEDVALAYLGIRPMEPSLRPRERLQNWLAEDVPGDDAGSEAVEAALRALGQVAVRTDLPSLAQLLEWDRNGCKYRLAELFLAGLDHLGRRECAFLDSFSDETLRSALGLHCLTVLVDKEMPRWAEALIDAKPQLAGETLAEVLTARIRNRRTYEERHLLSLNAAKHAGARRVVLPKLLDAFPVRATKWHFDKLRTVLEFALDHLPRDELREIVERKLSFGSMDTAQKTAWLGIGLRAWPEDFMERSLRFLAGRRDVTFRRLADVCAAGNERTRFSPANAGVPALLSLVSTFGRRFSPDWLNQRLRVEAEAGLAFSASEEEHIHERASILLRGCIGYLSREPSELASQALRQLTEDSSLASWSDELERAREEQAELLRQATHRHPSLADIANALDGGPPANASDLAECVVGEVRRLGNEIRDGNADAWRLFWNEDGRGRPTAAKPENSCRDALLYALRPRLEPLKVDLQPEPHYADERRADIRASAPGGNPAIPIEVKKQDGRDLWSAAENQLAKRYARDPAAGGNGIYLVLWFDDCTVPMNGRRPKSPAELEERLRESLAPARRRLVRIIVIDVSRVGHASALDHAP